MNSAMLNVFHEILDRFIFVPWGDADMDWQDVFAYFGLIALTLTLVGSAIYGVYNIFAIALFGVQ